MGGEVGGSGVLETRRQIHFKKVGEDAASII